MIPGPGRSAGEGISYPLQYSWASLVAQLVKNLPAVWETWVRSLGWEDPLEKGYPLQYSGLKNSMDCIVHRVTKSWTGLSDLLTHSLLVPKAPLSMEFSKQDSRVGCHFLLWGIFLNQGLNPGLLHCRHTLY